MSGDGVVTCFCAHNQANNCRAQAKNDGTLYPIPESVPRGSVKTVGTTRCIVRRLEPNIVTTATQVNAEPEQWVVSGREVSMEEFRYFVTGCNVRVSHPPLELSLLVDFRLYLKYHQDEFRRRSSN